MSSSCMTPSVSTSRDGYFSPGEHVLGLDGGLLQPHLAVFVRNVNQSSSIIKWDCAPTVEVLIDSCLISRMAVGTRSQNRGSSGRPSPTSCTGTPMKRQKLEFSYDLPQRVARVFEDVMHFGSAVSYTDPWWKIEYDDGDEEEYTETQMTEGLDLFKKNASTGNEYSSEEEEPSDDDDAGPGNASSDDDDAGPGNASSSEEEEVHSRAQVSYSAADSSVHGRHDSSSDDDAGPGRARVSYAAADYSSSADDSSDSMDESGVGEIGDEQQSGDHSSSVSSLHGRHYSANDSSDSMDESGVGEIGDEQQSGDHSSSVSSLHGCHYSADDSSDSMDESGVGEIGDEQQFGDHSSSVSSLHGRHYCADDSSDDSSSMDESGVGVGEIGDEQQSGDHSNDELHQLRERYIQCIKLFKSYSIEEFAHEVQNDDVSVGIEVSPDADSFVFGTQHPVDLHCLNSTESFHLQRAVPKVKPFSVRPAIKKTKYFKPSYGDGKTPTLPSKLHKFPSFSAGSVKFRGGVTGYLSIHLLEETKLGTLCSDEVTNTWNAANNLALTKYKESSVMNEPEWTDAMEQYKKYIVTQNYTFTGKADKAMSFPGISGILHLRIVYDMLQYIAGESYGANNAGGNPGAAKSLLANSFILLQAPGFKQQWPVMMQSVGDPQYPEVFQVENYENDYARWNQKLKDMTTATYQRAEAFFIKLPLQQQYNESAFYAIDIAFKIGCDDNKWDVLLSGKVAEETVVAATKLRRAELWEGSEHEESSQEEAEFSDSNSDSNATALLEWDPTEDDSLCSWRPAEDADHVEDADEVEDAGDVEDPFAELIALINRQESAGQVQEEQGHETQQGHETHTAELLESAATLNSGKMNRIRYPAFGTTGIAFGNAQSKPGINLEAARDQGVVYVSHPKIAEGKLRSANLAQFYQPYQRFGMAVQPRVQTRLQARKLPKMIAQYASEFETLLVDDSSTNIKEKAFDLIDDIFIIIEEYLKGVEAHPLHVRYELTFLTQMNRRIGILPPIKDETSPFKCLRLAKKADILDSTKKLTDMHKHVINGFRRLDEFPNLSTSIDANEWTAMIASAEAVVNFIGMGGGAKGTILKQSLDRAPEFFFEHYWMAHPEFITLILHPSEERNTNQPPAGTDVIRFGVNSNLLAFGTPPQRRAIEDEAPNITSLQSSLDYVDGTLSMYLTEGLPKLDQPAPYRKCMLLIYTALVAAGREAGDSSGVTTMFDCIQWTAVGLRVASVKYVFKEIAAALVALYKVEWANRNTRYIEKQLGKKNDEATMRRAADFGKKRKQFLLGLRDSHTKSQLGNLILNCLGNAWPSEASSPFDSRDNNSSKMTHAGRAT
jgi:hypothetical protein